MKEKVKKRTQRDYSLGFKLEVIEEVEKGEHIYNKKKIFSQTVRECRQQRERIGVSTIAGLFGISRQSYYKREELEKAEKEESEKIIEMIKSRATPP